MTVFIHVKKPDKQHSPATGTTLAVTQLRPLAQVMADPLLGPPNIPLNYDEPSAARSSCSARARSSTGPIHGAQQAVYPFGTRSVLLGLNGNHERCKLYLGDKLGFSKACLRSERTTVAAIEMTST